MRPTGDNINGKIFGEEGHNSTIIAYTYGSRNLAAHNLRKPPDDSEL